MRQLWYEPAADVSIITRERVRIMDRAVRSGVDVRLLAREYNTNTNAVRKAISRYRRELGRT